MYELKLGSSKTVELCRKSNYKGVDLLSRVLYIEMLQFFQTLDLHMGICFTLGTLEYVGRVCIFFTNVPLNST